MVDGSGSAGSADGAVASGTDGLGGLAGLWLGLAIVVALLVLAVWLVRRLGGPRSVGRTDLMRVVARLPLEPRRALYVVEVAGKGLLVGTSDQGLTLLKELELGDLGEVPPRQTFAALVAGAWARRRGGGPPASGGPTDETRVS